jgi:hypothetical protein
VLLGAIVFAAGWHGGLIGVMPALLVVIAFYLGGSAVRIARAVESWQAERTRRELGLEPTPWMLPVGLIVALWVIGWMLALIASGMLVYAIMGTGRTEASYEHVVYLLWAALSGTMLLLGAGHTLRQRQRRTLRDQRRVAADRNATRSGRLAGPATHDPGT